MSQRDCLFAVFLKPRYDVGDAVVQAQFTFFYQLTAANPMVKGSIQL